MCGHIKVGFVKSKKQRLRNLLELDESRVMDLSHSKVRNTKKAQVFDFKEGQWVLLYDARQHLFLGNLSQIWYGP